MKPFTLPEDLTLLDYFAIHFAPKPTKEQVDAEYQKDMRANPHNDSYKPARRTVEEIYADLVYRYAAAILKRRKQILDEQGASNGN